ncbi:cupin domain-containing protein [Shimia sp. SDUM112013]|uniref:cupin domain-containing protein n=1 Tax=Shimia sp. SDUM112013 TaxID=3136160 RepID=UPI0032EDD197
MCNCQATQLLEDDRVRVTRFDFQPGEDTGWHVHPFDYVITTVTECHLRIELPDGTVSDTLVPAGTAYQRVKGTEHNVINAGTAPMAFVEVELK